ncbi:hypothetical protein ACWEQ8_33100, partial [Streptomyces noursei]
MGNAERASGRHAHADARVVATIANRRARATRHAQAARVLLVPHAAASMLAVRTLSNPGADASSRARAAHRHSPLMDFAGDPETAVAFYSRIFGWTVRSHGT